MNLQELLAERDIQRQLVAFARAMDERNWEAIEHITAEDMRADFGTGEIVGRKEIVAYMRSFLDNCGTTQHFVGNFVIDVNGDVGTSESYVSDMHLGKDAKDGETFRTLGNYSDTWQKINGAWLMTQRIKDNRAVIGTLEVFQP